MGHIALFWSRARLLCFSPSAARETVSGHVRCIDVTSGYIDVIDKNFFQSVGKFAED